MSIEQTGTSGYTEDELASLTPDELSALQGDDGEEEILADLAKDEPEDVAVIPVEKSTEVANEVDEVKAEVKAEDAIQADDESTRPLYKVDAPANSDATRAELSTKKAEALQKLLDGEMTAAEYSTVDSEVTSQLNAIDRAEIKAEVSQDMTQQQLLREWDREIKGVITAAKADGLDYKSKPELMDEFDTLIRVFSQEASQKGMSDEGLGASKWALAQANSIMKTRHGIIAKTAAQVVAPAKSAGPRHELQTLSGLPNADRANVDNDTISRLGSLVGDDLEKAMASMSKADIEKLMGSV